MTETAQPAEVDALLEAIAIAGGQAKLAEALDIRQSAVSNWIARKSRIPAERVVKIESLTGVSRSRLRMDLWPARRPNLEKRA